MKLQNVIPLFQGRTNAQPVDVTITDDGAVESVVMSKTAGEPPGLLLPTLCHPHMHLDKAYLLTSNHPPNRTDQPSYTDLVPQSGSFQEALEKTAQAKARYTHDDLYRRGAQLLAASLRQGVTHVRAFVEVDHVTGLQPLHVGVALKRAFAPAGLRVQLCAFAQDPIFSPPHGAANRALLEHALRTTAEIDVLGTTPYVEASWELSVRNISWATALASELGLHLDFHLDYNLGEGDEQQMMDHGEHRQSKVMIYDVLDALEQCGWPRVVDNGEASQDVKTVVLGHCTRLTRLPARDLHELASRIRNARLPVHLVGLPTSDIFMMGRPDNATALPHARPRGTLQVPSLIRDYGLSACVGVNNVGNAFTPFGTGDPLGLASWGVGLYHAGTVADAELLYACVSWRARRAIGFREDDCLDDGTDDTLAPGARWRPRLMVRNEQTIHVPSAKRDQQTETCMTVPARLRLSIQDVVWDPPDINLRTIIW